MNEIIQNFQFIRPQWLWLCLPIIMGYILKLKYGKDQNVWQKIIPQHLYQQMIVSKGIKKSNAFTHFAMMGLLMATLSVAGPSWEKLPNVVYQTQTGKVILMDMSMSLRATDLSPNRLTRARFKAIDLVNEVKEGETGLVAYSGDAFVVSPLTDDINNLKTLIPVLSPEIMPTQGSSALTGLREAASLLENAGYNQGQIYWITDGLSFDEIKDIRNFILNSNYDLSALLIGTEAGAPITLENGQLLKDFNGKIVVPSINTRYMEQAMSGTSAKYQQFATDNSDIQAIKRAIDFEQKQQAEAIENTSGDALKDMGPYLVLLLLPIAAYAFRKGLLNVAAIFIFASILFTPNQTAYAQLVSPDNSTTTPDITLANPNTNAESVVDKIFKNADQRGKIAFDNSDFSKANELFEDNEWRAANAYKMGDYESAATLYSELLSNEQTNTKHNMYNQGNALAKLGKLEEALNAYNQTLERDTEHKQALQNKKIVEELLKQQQEQESQQDQNEKSSDENNKEQSQENKEESKGEGEENDSQQEQSDQNNSQENGQQGSESNDQQSDEQQNSNQQSGESENKGKEDESLKQTAQEQAQQESQAQQEQEQEQSKEQENELNQEGENQQDSEQQQSAISNQINEDDLTPEQKEEMQRMQMILNKVPDAPAYLLKRKMLLEAYKRKNNAPPPEQENW